ASSTSSPPPQDERERRRPNFCRVRLLRRTLSSPAAKASRSSAHVGARYIVPSWVGQAFCLSAPNRPLLHLDPMGPHLPAAGRRACRNCPSSFPLTSSGCRLLRAVS